MEWLAGIDWNMVVNEYVIPSAWIVAKILLIVLPLLGAVAYLTFAERKVIAAMQDRASLFGLVREAFPLGVSGGLMSLGHSLGATGSIRCCELGIQVRAD